MTAIARLDREARQFTPPDVMTINGEQCTHCFDAPVIPGDYRGKYVHVYYCDNIDEIELLDEAGNMAVLTQRRRDEIRMRFDEWNTAPDFA